MPYALLIRLCCAKLPETIGEQAEIDKLRFLQAQGLIEADIPYALPERGHHCYSGNATVMCVTRRGHLVAQQTQPGLPLSEVSEPGRPSVSSPFF